MLQKKSCVKKIIFKVKKELQEVKIYLKSSGFTSAIKNVIVLLLYRYRKQNNLLNLSFTKVITEWQPLLIKRNKHSVKERIT
jgi:hypothetical protein